MVAEKCGKPVIGVLTFYDLFSRCQASLPHGAEVANDVTTFTGVMSLANFKRGKCRYNLHCPHRGSRASWRARHGLKPVRLPRKWWLLSNEITDTFWKVPGKYVPSMMDATPRAWDYLHHTRPSRVREKRLERMILADRLDADGLAWPIWGQPTEYYW
jgi:hypothetical protein